jgi:hypothetical protein
LAGLGRMNNVIIHAFEVVTSCDPFCNGWIPDYIMVGVINYEFDIPYEKKLTTAKLNRAIGGDLQYIHCPVMANEWGAYCKSTTHTKLSSIWYGPQSWGQITMLFCNRWWQPNKSITVWSQVGKK